MNEKKVSSQLLGNLETPLTDFVYWMGTEYIYKINERRKRKGKKNEIDWVVFYMPQNPFFYLLLTLLKVYYLGSFYWFTWWRVEI